MKQLKAHLALSILTVAGFAANSFAEDRAPAERTWLRGEHMIVSAAREELILRAKQVAREEDNAMKNTDWRNGCMNLPEANGLEFLRSEASNLLNGFDIEVGQTIQDQNAQSALDQQPREVIEASMDSFESYEENGEVKGQFIISKVSVRDPESNDLETRFVIRVANVATVRCFYQEAADPCEGLRGVRNLACRMKGLPIRPIFNPRGAR